MTKNVAAASDSSRGNNNTNLKTIGQQLQTAIEHVVIGKSDVVKFCLVALLAQGHVLLEDIPGVGKTTLVKTLARTLGADFRRIQFTPDVLPSDITGISIYDQKNNVFAYHPGPIMSHIVLADEINRASPKTQSALLECMEEGQTTVDGLTHPLPKPFLVMATQNPDEFHGTFPLPESQLDRFMFCLQLGYPSPEEELTLLERFRLSHPLEDLQVIVPITEIPVLQAQVKNVYVSDSIRRYMIELVQAFRSHPRVRLGASPRATLAFFRSTQALAGLYGRNFVLPDDVKELVPILFKHRIFLKDSGSTEEVIRQIINSTHVPLS